MPKPTANSAKARPLPIAQDADRSADDAIDIKLVDRIRAGDSAAWSDLTLRYQNRLFSVCLRMVHDRQLAADLAQDAFVKIIQGLHTYDGRSRLSTWLIRVTMNVCLSRLRSEKIRRHASLEGMAERRGDGSGSGGGGGGGGGISAADEFRQTREPDQVTGVQDNEDKERVLHALSLLDPDQRAVLILCDCRGLAYEQIAEVLGVAVGTVKSRLFRARAALRDAVESIGSRADSRRGV